MLLVGFVAACGGTHAAQRKLGSALVPTIRRESPAPKIVGPARLVVTVVDGDLNLRVRRAAVSLWGRNARTDAAGVAGPRRDAVTSSFVRRPFSPLPVSARRSTPSSRARRRTLGLACT